MSIAYGSNRCASDLGYYGNNSPQQLFDFVSDYIRVHDNDIDAIIMNGDFIPHYLPLQNKNAN